MLVLCWEGLAEKTPSYTDVETANDSTRVGGEISGWAYLNQYTSIPAAEQKVRHCILILKLTL